LDKNCPEEKRSEITELNLANQKLEGVLKLEGFVNLEKLTCSVHPTTYYPGHNRLAQLEVTNCPELEVIKFTNIRKLEKITIKNCLNLKEFNCEGNLLTVLDLSQNKKLEKLDIRNNNFAEQDLSFIGHLVNLEELLLGNSKGNSIKQGVYNRFIGSLKHLKNMSQLKQLDIRNTDISSGLEFLPESLTELCCLTDLRKDA
jgi:Leucine-rich repeat (LRR) protein